MKDHWAIFAIAALDKLHIDHVSYTSSKKEVECAAIACSKGEVIVIVGPPRAGKTRILAESVGAVLDSEPDADGLMNAVYIEAGNDSTAGAFSTKDFYFEALGAIRHPDAKPPQKNRKLEKLPRNLPPEWAIKHAFRRSLHHRRTRYFVVDEAHHVKYAPKGKEAATKILDGFKSLANKSRCTLVLCGSYALLDSLVMSPHFCGRTHLVEIPRYRANETDLAAFASVLELLGEHLRFGPGEDLLRWGQYLFEGSLGCVGSLMIWLRAALGKVLLTESDTLKLFHLEASIQPKSMRSAIAKEIEDGEVTIDRVRLRLQTDPAAQADDGGMAEEDDRPKKKPIARSAKSTHKKPQRKPFQRITRRNRLDGRS